MRQIIALVAEGKVKFALVDDATEEITEFAQVLAPNGFSITDAATLGINLAQVVGITKRTPALKAPGSQPELTPGPARSTVPKKKKGTPRRGQGAGPYINDQMVIDIVNMHPSGTTIPDIARIIAEREGLDYTWCRTSVNNRLVNMRDRMRKHGTPMPFIDGHQPHDVNKPLLRPYPVQTPNPVEQAEVAE